MIAGLTSVVARMNGNIEDFDSVVLRDPVFVMSMVIDFSNCDMPLNEVERKLREAGEKAGLSVTVYRVDQLLNE